MKYKSRCRHAGGLQNLILASIVVMLGLGGSCNFDSAFQRYCEGNPRCRADAASGPETRPEPGPEAGPEAVPEAGPEAEPEPDAGPDAEPEAGPEAEEEPLPEPGPEAEPDASTDLPFDVGSSWPFRDGGADGPWSMRPQVPRPCSSGPYDCASNEICHPIGQVCMTTCQTSSDCPGWLDNCSEIVDWAGNVLSPKVCQCTGSFSCDSYAPGFRCNPPDNLCEPPCRNNGDCSLFNPPRNCDQFTNVCPLAQPCQKNADCYVPAQPRCDPTYGRCYGCTSNADCASRTDNLTECGRNGACTKPPSPPSSPPSSPSQ